MNYRVTGAIAAFLLISCTSFDVQKKVAAPSRAGASGDRQDAGIQVFVMPQKPEPPEIIEKPVYIPHEETEKQPQKPSGTDAVRQAQADGILKPQDYSHAAVLYDYDADRVYEVYCQPLRVTDVALRRGEKIAEPPFVSDSERWKIGAGVSYENGEAMQHVYVKPDEASLEATLIINTDQRVYHLILRSFKTVHMPKVRWNYPGNPLPLNFASAGEAKGQAGAGGGNNQAESEIMADPRFLSFNYLVTYPLFGKPRWLPELVYDDGKKTYISFPGEALQAQLPAVFENRAEVVNYRVTRNIIVIDKLIEALTVRIGKRQVLIRKKKGKA